MESVDPFDEGMPLLLMTENLPDDVIINQLTPPLPSLEDHLWMNHESGASTNVKASDRETHPLFEPELLPAEVMPGAKVNKHECSECGKVFRTTNTLNKHLLTHQPDGPCVCNTCQLRCKNKAHLTAHMLTHQKKTAHCRTKPGCHEVFCDQHSLQCTTPNPTEPSPVLWDHPHPFAETENSPTSNSFHYVFDSPCKPTTVSPQLKHFVSYGARSSSNTEFASGAGSHELKCYQDVNLSQVKRSVIQEPWSSPAVNLPASHGSLTSNQWPQSVYPPPEHYMVDPMPPGDIWEDDLDFSVTNPQSSKVVLPVKTTNTGPQCSLRPSTASPKKVKPLLLKHSLQEPERKQQFITGAQPCSKSDNELGSVAPHSHQKKFYLLPQPLPKKGKKTTKTNVPNPPLPSPKPKTKKRSRPHPQYQISPSQVAMASFTTETAPSLTIKGGGSAAMTQDGKESGTRTHLKYSPGSHVQPWPSFPQAPTTSSSKMDEQLLKSIFSTPDKNVSCADGQIQEFQGFQFSPLVIPVSVPILDKEVALNIPATQSLPHPAAKSRRPDLLRSLIIPSLTESGGQGGRAAGGYPSQLRSPTYLVDHLVKPGIQPLPYTPPPMLSPLRPGTGLYFNTLPQSQPCPPPFSTYITSLDGKATMSLKADNTCVNIEPKINVGPGFQAEIPPMRNLLLMLYDEHPAQLVWAPPGDLSSNPQTQQKVSDFLNLCCSSVLPGGGTNTELALHCLQETQGDTLAALDLLLLRGDYGTSSHPLRDYHYTGSDRWNTREMRLFRKALFRHNKNFQLIHNVLQSKSVAQCVEYYYAMKKLKKFGQHKKRADKNSAGFHSVMEVTSETRSEIRRSFNRAMGTHEGQYAENKEYACQECGRGFHKVKSRSAHMRIHRQQKQKLEIDVPRSRKQQLIKHQLESSRHLT